MIVLEESGALEERSLRWWRLRGQEEGSCEYDQKGVGKGQNAGRGEREDQFLEEGQFCRMKRSNLIIVVAYAVCAVLVLRWKI